MSFTNRRWFKNIKAFVLAIIFIGCMLVLALHDISKDYISNLINHVIGWLCAGFFGFGYILVLIKQVKYALQGRGMVSLTDKGLFVRDDFVAWGNIVDIRATDYGVIIYTNDTKERLLRASWWSKLNYKMVGSLITVSDYDYDGSQEEFVAILKQHIEHYRKQNSAQ